MRFHYLDWGNPDGPDMLLLHGFAQTCHSWDFVALAFCDRYHVVALDQRGHGDSDWAEDGDYSPETQQADIAGVVQALNLRDFVLMGLSMGGRNSFTYAATHPGHVRALVVVDAGPENMRSGSQNISNFVQQEDELDSVDDFVQRVLQYNPRRDPVQVRGSIMHNLKHLPNGRWTWKYDRRLRQPGGRRFQHDPDTTERLWGYLESLQMSDARSARVSERHSRARYRRRDAPAHSQRAAGDCRERRTPRDGRQPVRDSSAS